MSDDVRVDSRKALFREQMTAAEKAWRVTRLWPQTETNDPITSGLPDGSRYVEAGADTGSKYVVVATRLEPVVAVWQGGDVLVTVLAPWQAAYVLQDTGYLDPPYVAEKLCGGRRGDLLHGGDLMGLTMTVRCALGREGVTP